MTKYISLLLLLSILVIGIFGFTSMNHETGHNGGCIASNVDSALCPENIVAMSAHHIQGFVSFFSVIPSTPFIFLLTLFAIFLSARFLSIQERDSGLISPALRQSWCDPERQITRPREVTHWLALLENSPSLHKVFVIISNLKNLCKQTNLKTIKNIKLSVWQLNLTLCAGWSLMRTVLRQVQITKARPTIFAPFTARITLQPIL